MGKLGLKYFELYEMVDRATFSRWGDTAWLLFNSDLLSSVDGVREYFGVPCYVNNWWNGHGDNQYRGYRPPNCPIGAKHSEHKSGCAADITIEGIDAETARQRIMEDKDHPLLERIMRMEKDVSWVHIDIKPV